MEGGAAEHAHRDAADAWSAADAQRSRGWSSWWQYGDWNRGWAYDHVPGEQWRCEWWRCEWWATPPAEGAGGAAEHAPAAAQGAEHAGQAAEQAAGQHAPPAQPVAGQAADGPAEHVPPGARAAERAAPGAEENPEQAAGGAAEHTPPAAQVAEHAAHAAEQVPEHPAQAAEQAAEPAAGGAAEHAPPGAQAAEQGVPAAPILLDSRELAAIRARERLTKGQLHGQARKALNDFANADYAGPVCLEDLFPWKRYVALHDAGEELVGPGISRAILDQFAEVRDPNRLGRPRSDFIFERVDGSAYRVHPGSKPRNDARPVYCPPSRAPEQTGVCFWHYHQACFTLEDACQVPQTDKLGKEEAFRLLKTNPSRFQWWRFAANLGAHTQYVIGDGLVDAAFQVSNDKVAMIRLQRRDGSTVDVELRYTPRRGVRTLVHR